MKPLPPSIEALLPAEPTFLSYELLVAIAHEACRLQREADLQYTDLHGRMSLPPLVVPGTEG